MYIQNNLAALNAHRSLNINNNKTSKKIEKLSGGMKINRSADDAAGLAISEKMRAQIRGMSMAQKNAQDGVSLIQTAEGALSVTQDLLHRMRELAVQSSTDINDEMERDALDIEYQHLMQEIDEIAAGAAFNGIKLFDGSLAGGMTFQSDIYTLDFTAFTATPSPSSQINWADVNGKNYTKLIETVTDQIVPQIIGKMEGKLTGLADFFDSTIYIGMSASRDGPSAAYASVSFAWGLGPDRVSLNFNINLDQVDPLLNASGDFKDDASRSNFEAMASHEMTHALMAVTSTVGMASSDRYPLWFIEGMAQTMSGDMGWITNSGYLSDPPETSEIQNLLKYSELTSGSTKSSYASGYLACMYLAWEAGNTSAVTSANLASGVDKILSQLADGNSLDTVIANVTGNKYTGLDDFEKTMASKPEAVQFVKDLYAAMKISSGVYGLGSVLADNLNSTDIVLNDPATNTFLQIDDEYRWVTNLYPSGYSPANGGGSYIDGTAIDVPNPNPYIPGSGGIGSSGAGPLTFQVGPNYADSISMSIKKMNTSSIGVMHPFGFLDRSVNSTAINTCEEAHDAIEVVDGAINMVSNQRADLGAVQNRLEFRAKGLGISEENLTDAESRIRDADMAGEMTGFVKSDILSKASQSMLAQANSLPQAVLSLING